MSAASTVNCPILPKTDRMLRALSAPAPITSVTCHATCSRTKDTACLADLANGIASNATAAVAPAPSQRVMLND
eukprot:2574299-Alexandrium_andersonii.AAC.1